MIVFGIFHRIDICLSKCNLTENLGVLTTTHCPARPH